MFELGDGTVGDLVIWEVDGSCMRLFGANSVGSRCALVDRAFGDVISMKNGNVSFVLLHKVSIKLSTSKHNDQV